MANLDSTALAKLANEMVMGIRNYKTIFADFGITEEDYYEILKNDYYRKIKDQIAIEWNATTSTGDRLTLQGKAGSEVLLPVMLQRALSPTEPLTSVIDALKMAAKIGGIGESKTANAGNLAERFVITINLGADTKGNPITEHYDKPIAIGTGGDMSE
jgi:hypothetical protein